MLLIRAALLLVVLAPTLAVAQRETSREALARLEETLTLKLEQGGLATKELLPAIVVSVTPAFEETRAWYPTEALASLVRVFGATGLRMCEACMAPRVSVEDGQLIHSTVAPDSGEIVRLDESVRGTAAPARTAIYLDETRSGVSIRIVELHNSRIVLAENVDPRLREMARTKRNFTLSEELQRRARGDSLTHTFLDVAMYPGQHVSLDWTEQWGDTNANLSGVTLSLFDPVIGLGGAYYRVMPRALNIMVGGKVIMSVPSALVSALSGQASNVIDPILTGVFVVRIPIASSNYGVTLTASTNGRVGVGFSLMNLTALPFLP